jgi:threonine dehydratase
MAPRSVQTPTEADLRDAAALVAKQLRPTPLVELPVPGAGPVLAKLETMQPTGSFKVRGALVTLSAYAGSGRAVVSASTGNHALGVAYAAAKLGVPATIVVPRKASAAKVEALRALGVEPVFHGEGSDDAERHGLELAGDCGVYVSPYNDRHVIAGQSTCAAEILEAVEGPCTLIVPVGGGGLIAGAVLAAVGRPEVRVVGVEAAASPVLSTSVARGRDVPVPASPTLADALAGDLEPGSITVPIAASGVHSFVGVTEPEIVAGIRFLAGHGLVAEGGGAVGVAALLAGRVPVAGTPIVLVTGRNIARPTLLDVLS